MTFDESENHMEHCDLRPISCRCGVVSSVGDIAHHEATECPLTELDCPLHKIGYCNSQCSGFVSRQDLETHLHEVDSAGRIMLRMAEEIVLLRGQNHPSASQTVTFVPSSLASSATLSVASGDISSPTPCETASASSTAVTAAATAKSDAVQLAVDQEPIVSSVGVKRRRTSRMVSELLTYNRDSTIKRTSSHTSSSNGDEEDNALVKAEKNDRLNKQARRTGVAYGNSLNGSTCSSSASPESITEVTSKPTTRRKSERRNPSVTSNSAVQEVTASVTTTSNGRDLHSLNYLDGDRYFGEMKNDMKHGWGKYACANAPRFTYEGQWVNDQKHGQGTLRFDKRHMKKVAWMAEHYERNESGFGPGDSYVGQWEKDEKHGQGLWTYASGETYEGMHVHNLAEGYGESKMKNGDRAFKGEWKKDKFLEGTYVPFKNKGRVYTGSFQGQVYHGMGTLKDRAGNVLFTRQWNKGKMVVM